jgi:hypothetical protein
VRAVLVRGSAVHPWRRLRLERDGMGWDKLLALELTGYENNQSS